ncbi:trypsin-like serine peptidase [Agromyces bracchium]|uniref:Serine protease n=1 Tax=Agromyces bracchium TaxID=88376 RepID=A0A6I3M8N1_9MICO|nr:serine protease [Agromyces bracchium]MTH69829.1 hypothetical protein [Agromyces bracchium]
MDDAGASYRRLLSARADGGPFEAAGGGNGDLPDTDVAVASLIDGVRYLEERLGKYAEPEVLAELVGGAEHGLRVISGKDDGAFDRHDLAGLEAVVHSDGTRPVFFVEDDFIDVLNPAAATHAAALSRVSAAVRAACSAVGRVVDPSSALGFRGTAWAIGDGIVATNFHVLKAIAVGAARPDGRFVGELKPDVAVDFGGEVGGSGPDGRRFPVHRVLGVGSEGAPERASTTLEDVNFDGLDLAILELEPVDGQDFPAPVAVARGDDPATHGALASKGRSVYVVGFPGNPKSTTADVFGRLFAGVAGVKRLAPGTLAAGRGDVPGDDRRWVIAHDASTLGGSSGSPVIDLETDGRAVLGAHFAGAPDRTNWAHSLEGASDELAEIVPGW